MRARGLTLLEVLVGLALFAVLSALTLPIVVSQTRRLTWDEVLAQIERQAAVVRGDAQRRSEPVWFEARWLEDEQVWALGTRAMQADEAEPSIDSEELSGVLLGEMESFMTEDMTDRPGTLEEEPETMSGFEVVMRLPVGFEIRGRLPEEMTALRDHGGPIEREQAGIEPATLLEESAVPVADEDSLLEKEDRALVAVFLPDGTLIGPECLYVRSPQGRLATVTPSRWLGAVRCRTLTLGELMSGGEVEEPLPGPEPETIEPEPAPADGSGGGS